MIDWSIDRLIDLYGAIGTALKTRFSWASSVTVSFPKEPNFCPESNCLGLMLKSLRRDGIVFHAVQRRQDTETAFADDNRKSQPEYRYVAGSSSCAIGLLSV